MASRDNDGRDVAMMRHRQRPLRDDNAMGSAAVMTVGISSIGSRNAAQRDRAWQIAKWAVVSRLLTISIALISTIFLSDFDTSASRSLQPLPAPEASLLFRLLSPVLKIFVRWDAIYFLNISKRGYMFENEHAFFPLVPLAIRAVKQAVFDWLLPANSVGQDLSFVLAGITISNLSFVGAAVLLYRLSCKVFDDEPFAYLAGVCYCFLPASIFMSAVYTESTFALISFGAMLLVVKRRYWYAAVATGVSTLCRANGIFYIGFFVWDLLIAGRPWSRSSGCRTVTTVASIACLALVASSGYIGFQYYGYRSFCLAAGSRAPDRPSWCESSIPLLYGYVQDRYWNVGFLRYFTLMQLPNFGLALPMLLLSVFGICEYAGHDLARFFSLGNASSPLQDGNADGSGSSDNRDHSCYFKSSALPFIYLWAVLLALSFFVMHVQVITRLFSSVPPVYWYAAHVLTRPTAKLLASSLWKRLVLSIHPSRWVLNYFILYSAVGATLFSAFYPPA